MKKKSQYLLALWLLILGFMPSSAFASYALSLANGSKGNLNSSSTYYFNSGNTMPVFCPSEEILSNVVFPKKIAP